MTDPTTSASAPTAPAVEAPAAPVVIEKTLADFRAEKAQPAAPVAQVTPPAEPTRSPLSAAPEPPEPADEPETPAITPAPEADGHRWKDPITGVRLDLRRRDHRRIKTLLEDGHRTAQENVELRSRLGQVPQPVAQPEPPRQPAAPPQMAGDPNDPRPTLDQFADDADPYAAHTEAVARWAARQEHRTLTAQRSAVERTQRTQAAIAGAQQRFDAQLPTVRQRYPDFDAAYSELHDSLARTPIQIRTPIIHRLLTTEQGHDVAYYLGNRPEQLQRLVTARTPQEQQFVMGEVLAEVKAALKAPAAAPPTPPAAPMAPVHGGGTPTTYNAASADLAAFRAKHGVRGGRRISA